MATVFTASVVAEARAELGESPLWDGDAGLRWLDVLGRRLLTRRLDGQETSVELPTTVTAVELGSERQLLAVTGSGFGWLDPETGRLEQIATTIDDETISMNDDGIDARGRCWAGSAVRDDSRRAALYRLEGTSVTTHADGIGMSNGIDWSRAGDALYHVDSSAGTVKAWEYDMATGDLGASRVLRDVPEEIGLPDGLTVDADGNVWLAIWGAGQVWRLDPTTGETTAVVEVPTPYTTSCAFGGPELSTLYITTANYNEAPGGGLLYAADVGARGLRPHRFKGAG